MRHHIHRTYVCAGLLAAVLAGIGYLAHAQISPVGTARTFINMPVLQSTTGLVSVFSFLNLGPGDATVNVTAYGPDGISIDTGGGANPANPGVRAGQQFTGSAAQLYNLAAWTRAGWLQARTDQSSVMGLTLVSDSLRFDAVPAGRSDGAALVLTSVEWSDRYATELHFVNLDNATRRVTFFLRTPEGIDIATSTVSMPPKGSQAIRLNELFTSLSNPFSGYLLVHGESDVALAALLASNSAVSGLPGVPLPPSSANGARMYLAHMAAGGASSTTRLTLVNPTSRDATILIRAVADDGASIATVTDVSLRAGQQFQQELGKLFNLDSNTLVQGSLLVESSVEGIVGDVNYLDPTGNDRFRASVPLATTPLRSLVIPYVSNDATLSTRLIVSNPSNARATVQVRVMTPSGAFSGPNTLSIPAGGRASRTVADLLPVSATQSGGYITLDSDQPVTALALVGIGTQGDFAAIGAQAGRGSDTTPASAPAIDASPSSLDFGSVAAGSNRELPLTIRNLGSAALTVSSIASSNDRFTVTGPATPFPIAPGGQQAVSVRFAPQAGGTQNGALTIASNDPNRPSLTIPMTGAGAPAAGPSISISTTTLDFGSVAAGASADQVLTVRNAGSAILVINSINTDNPAFTVKSPTAFPVSVGAGVQVAVTLTYRPSGAGGQSATLSIASNDPGRPTATVALTGAGISTGSAGQVAVSPFSLDFGTIEVNKSKEMQLRVGNPGGAPLSVNSITSSDSRFIASPTGPFNIDPGAQQVVNVRFLPTLADTYSATLTISSNDATRPSLSVPLTGKSVTVRPLFSDSFNRADADKCSLGQSDNTLLAGGANPITYVPLFSDFDGIAFVPKNVELKENTLFNSSYNYSGVVFSRSQGTCPISVGIGTNLGQDLNIRVDLQVPTDNTGAMISQAGLFFHSRLALTGDNILLPGGNNAGYWVQLNSTGEVKVKCLNPIAVVASSGKPATFDTKAFHTLEVSVQGTSLQVSLDGKLLLFNQGGNMTTTVLVPNTWEGPPAAGINQGAAGILFSAEDNPELINGQRADNLVVTTFRPIGDLPVQSNFR